MPYIIIYSRIAFKIKHVKRVLLIIQKHPILLLFCLCFLLVNWLIRTPIQLRKGACMGPFTVHPCSYSTDAYVLSVMVYNNRLYNFLVDQIQAGFTSFKCRSLFLSFKSLSFFLSSSSSHNYINFSLSSASFLSFSLSSIIILSLSITSTLRLFVSLNLCKSSFFFSLVS